ncbi:hypothetical protein WN943_004880 [Citrus x changshan-huyou]
MLDGLNIRLVVIFVSGFIFTSVTVDAGKFPTLVTHQESLEAKVNETKAVVKFQLKKVLCMGVAVGNCSMEEKQVFQNVQLSVNFLVSLLKKSKMFAPEEYHGKTTTHILKITGFSGT